MEYISVKAGERQLLMALVISSIQEEDTNWLYEDELGDAVLSFFEEETGMTLSQVMQQIKNEYSISKLDKNKIKIDANTMTIRELATKYQIPYHSMHHFLTRNNISYKKIFVNGRTPEFKDLENQIRDFNGLLTVSEIAHKTNRTIKQIENIIYKRKLPYKKVRKY